MMAIAIAIRIAQAYAISLKIRESAEFFESGIDFGSREGAESLHAKAFATEAPHHGAKNDRAAQLADGDVFRLQVKALLSQVADESSGKTIAGSGGVENVVEKIAGDDEERIAAEQHRAVFAALDDQRVRTHIENALGGFAQVRMAGKHFRFTIVDQQEVPVADGRKQLVTEIGDPVVHGVAAGQAHVRHLIADRRLQSGLNVAEQKIFCRLVFLGNLGIEVRENVQVGLKRGAIVHVVGIFSGPKKRLPRDAFQTFEIDPVMGQQVGIFLSEIVAHDADGSGFCKEARGKRYIGGGTSEHTVHATVRSFDAVIGDGTNDNKRHLLIVAAGASGL